MLRWTLRTVALCAIALLAFNLAFVYRADLAALARLAVNQEAPPTTTGTALTAHGSRTGGSPAPLGFPAGGRA